MPHQRFQGSDLDDGRAEKDKVARESYFVNYYL